MRLTELDPEWVRLTETPGTRRRGGEVDITTAQGMIFLCPTCFQKNGGPVGTHSVLTWFRDRGVPDHEEPGPGRWAVTGTGFEDITLSPSIDISSNGDGEWHGFIQNGGVT